MPYRVLSHSRLRGTEHVSRNDPPSLECIQPLDRRLARFDLPFDVFLPVAAFDGAAAWRQRVFRQKTGYSSLIVLRGLSSKRFYAAKYVATFLSGAVVAIAPLLLDFYLTSLIFPQAMPEPSSGMYPIFAYSMWSDIFFSSPYLYVAMYLALIFVAAGVIACIPFVFSHLLSNKALVTCSGFFLCSIAAYLFGSSDTAYLSPIDFMRPDQPYWGYEFWQIASVVGFIASLEITYLVWLCRHDAAA